MARNDVQRKISDSEMKVLNRNKGEAFSGEVHIREKETGKELYTNKDVRDLAAWSVKRGGAAANDNMLNWHSINKWIEENWQEIWECPKCHAKKPMFISSIYQGQLFTDGTRGIRCDSCWSDSKVKEIPAEIEKSLYNKFEWIERYVNLGYSDLSGRTSLIAEYIKENING